MNTQNVFDNTYARNMSCWKYTMHVWNQVNMAKNNVLHISYQCSWFEESYYWYDCAQDNNWFMYCLVWPPAISKREWCWRIYYHARWWNKMTLWSKRKMSSSSYFHNNCKWSVIFERLLRNISAMFNC